MPLKPLISGVKLITIGKSPEKLGIDLFRIAGQGLVIEEMEQSAIAKQSKLNVDCCLLDGEVSVDDTLILIDSIKALAPACKFLLYSAPTSANIVPLLQAGVTGVLSSLTSAEQLLQIVEAICAGQYFLDQKIAQMLAIRQIKKMLKPFDTLSSREFDVFCLLAEGCSLKVIAEQLGISSKTVSNCQSQIKLKLTLANRRAIVYFAKSHGLMIEKDI